jgi:hypothetical protein
MRKMARHDTASISQPLTPAQHGGSPETPTTARSPGRGHRGQTTPGRAPGWWGPAALRPRPGPRGHDGLTWWGTRRVRSGRGEQHDPSSRSGAGQAVAQPATDEHQGREVSMYPLTTHWNAAKSARHPRWRGGRG